MILLLKNNILIALGTTLQDTLQEYGVEQLVITGMMTHMCIDSTTRAAAGIRL